MKTVMRYDLELHRIYLYTKIGLSDIIKAHTLVFFKWSYFYSRPFFHADAAEHT